jgi:tetratricopeptide (TPR) repeat protein
VTEALQQEIRTLRSLHNSERDPWGRVFAPLADAYRRAGQIPEAVRLLNDGLSRLPDFVPGHVVAAQLYLEQGLGEEAGFAARRALDLDPDNVNALRSLLRVLEEKGATAEAEEVRDHLVALEPDFRREPAASRVVGDGAPAAAPLSTSALEEPFDPLAEPVFDLGDLATASEPEPVLGGAFDTGRDDTAVVELHALAPDPEPVFELDSLTAGPETGEVVDIGLLSADEPEPLPVDATALPEAEPVFDLAALAPAAPEEPEEPVFDMAALAPEEPEEPVLDMAALAPEEPEEPVFDMAALAPEEPEEPVLDMAALAPEEPEEPVVDMDALAPESVVDTDVDEVIDVDVLAPSEPDEVVVDDEVVIDMDALRPDSVGGTEGSEEEAETVAPVEDDDVDDAGAGEPVYTRTLAELYVKQGAVDRALGVLRHLLAADPDNRDLVDRIAQLEAGDDGAIAEPPGGGSGHRRTRQPEESDVADEPEEEVESLARDLAQSGESEHDVETPFAWGEQESEAAPPEGPTIRDYFDGLLSWDPEEDE